MLTVKQALEMDGISEEFKDELKKHSDDSFVCLDQDNKIHIVENSEHNRNILKGCSPT